MKSFFSKKTDLPVQITGWGDTWQLVLCKNPNLGKVPFKPAERIVL